MTGVQTCALPILENEVGGLTALMNAFLRGNLECAQLLIDLGANPNTITKEGNILHSAAASDNLEAVKMALKYCQDKRVEITGYPPWCEAWDDGGPEYETIKELLS